MGLGEGLHSLGARIQLAFFWLAVRKDLPRAWTAGGYSRIKIARFSLVIFSLLNFSALALGSTAWNTASSYSLWLGFDSAAYILIAMVYLFGLRMWYGPVSGFLIVSAVVNYAFDSAGGPAALSPLNSPNFNDAVALTWLYLVLIGLVLMRYDSGSRLNELLSNS